MLTANRASSVCLSSPKVKRVSSVSFLEQHLGHHCRSFVISLKSCSDWRLCFFNCPFSVLLPAGIGGMNGNSMFSFVFVTEEGESA